MTVATTLDQVDLALIEILREDGRTPNKALAGQLGIAETTVASRIRHLREGRTMAVTLRRDIYSKGFDLQCFADVSVSGRPVDQVAGDLSRLEAVSSVSLMLGTPEILAVFNAVDRLDLLNVLEQQIARVAGVGRVELHTAVDIRKFQTGYANLENLRL